MKFCKNPFKIAMYIEGSYTYVYTNTLHKYIYIAATLLGTYETKNGTTPRFSEVGCLRIVVIHSGNIAKISE